MDAMSMGDGAVGADPTIYTRLRSRSCPDCQGVLHRTWRRPVDRVISHLVPMHRYRCGTLSCQWEGNLRVEPKDFQETDRRGIPLEVFTRPRRESLPWSFVVCSSLALVGFIVMLLLGAPDLFQPRVHDRSPPSRAEVTGASIMPHVQPVVLPSKTPSQGG